MLADVSGVSLNRGRRRKHVRKKPTSDDGSTPFVTPEGPSGANNGKYDEFTIAELKVMLKRNGLKVLSDKRVVRAQK